MIFSGSKHKYNNEDKKAYGDYQEAIMTSGM